jgi:archaellum component FlaG (FlaF/FlaG flagellin family)
MSEKLKAKDIIITVVVVILFAAGLVLVLNIYKSEGEKRSASVSDLGEKDPNHIEVDVKVVSIDPNKGDIVARLEFLPKGNYTKDEGLTLAREVKLFVNGATGKQETDFPKGKKMNPMEVVVQMYDGLVTDYPFDKHKAYLEMYFVPGKPETLSNQMSEGGPLKNKNGEREKQYCLISAIFSEEKTAEKTKEKLFTE